MTTFTQTRGRARIGVIVPVSNTNCEPDMVMLAPPGVSVHFARSGGYDVDAIPDETQMQRYSETPMDDVVEGLAHARPDVVLYGCTSATLAQGPEFDRAYCAGIAALAGAPAVTAAGAVVEALGNLGVTRFAFASPYVAGLNDLAIGFVEAAGFSCVGRFDAPDPISNDGVAAITPEAVMGFAAAADGPEAEAIVLSCTDMRALEAVAMIEARQGKPVVTSNQALMHCALKRLGIGCAGSLLSHHRLGQIVA